MRAKLLLALGAWALLGLSAAEAKKRFYPAPYPIKDNKPDVLNTDPAEPPLAAEVSIPGLAAQKSQAFTSARGPILRLNTTGGYSGTAQVAFSQAPPMRFTIKLTGVPNHHLRTLSLTTGSVALRLEGVHVDGGPTVRYFDPTGRALPCHRGAEYTVIGERLANGTIDLSVRRAPGAALARDVTVRWESNLGFGGGEVDW